MVGYDDSSRVHKMWDPLDRNIITSRDVVFDENLIFETSSVPEELDYYSLLQMSPEEQMVLYNFLLFGPTHHLIFVVVSLCVSFFPRPSAA